MSLDLIYRYILSKLTQEEMELLLQNPENLTIIIAGRTINEMNKQTKNGKRAIHRIRHKGQSLFRRTSRTGSSTTFFFGEIKERSNPRGNKKDS
jgi:hypothetical protein